MGKKLQGAKLRAKKRATAALNDLQEQQADVDATRTISEAPDEALFVLDTTGEANVPHHLRPTQAKQDAKKFQRHGGLSAKEQTLVERLRSRHKPEELQRMADQGRKMLEQQQRGRRRPGTDKTPVANLDLWDSNNDNDNPKKNKATRELSQPRNKKVAKTVEVVVQVDVAKPGQSYHPDPVAHAQILEKATAIELARERKKRERATPLSQGMSAETRALLLPDSSDDEDNDDDGDDDNKDDEETSTPLLKRAAKLTKAQRNKKKRRRVEEAMEKQAKKQKSLIKQLNQVHQFKKELNRQDEAKRQLALQQQKEKTLPPQSIPGKDVEFKAMDPEHAPIVAVVLPATSTTDDANTTTSLRTLRPRGSLARDRVASWADRQVAVAPRAGVRGGGAMPSRQQKRRPKSVKGRHNAGTKGIGFDLLG